MKPVFAVILIFTFLRYSGAMDVVADTTSSAVLASGLMDSTPEDPDFKEIDFNYNFMIKDLQGNKISMDQYKGKVIFLNLWATWCGPCRAEMPTIQKLYDGVKQDNIVFVMLSLDTDQDTPKIVKYVQGKAFTFPVYQPSGKLTDQLNVPSIPSTFIISKSGKIIAREVGTANYNTAKYKSFLDTEAKK